MRTIVWQPSEAFKSNSTINAFRNWLNRERQLELPLNYEILWQWSVDNSEAFWQSVWEYFEVDSPTPYKFIRQGTSMYDTQWFGGARVNYVQHIFKNKHSEFPALISVDEMGQERTYTWDALEREVAAAQQYITSIGLKKGDVVCAIMPNIPETTIFFLACASLGIIWSSCSPDFGDDSIISRFGQLKPSLLLAVDGYAYNGKQYDRISILDTVCQEVDSIQEVLLVSYIQDSTQPSFKKVTRWESAIKPTDAPLYFEFVPFEHPIWVLYSSGTTGIPKAITHSQGGVLLEHLKYLTFNGNVKKGDRLFWYTTTGWMMWNYVQASLLVGATIVLYEGSPTYPALDSLWGMSAKYGIQHFGTSAPFLVACMKAGLQIGQKHDLSDLISIGSTGSPLPAEAYDYVYEAIKKDVWLCSISGGTDICTAFVGGSPLKPVHKNELQCRSFGCDMAAFNENGQPVIDEVGEMVVRQAMPSMPIYFWNDADKKRYKTSYFEHYEGVWRHGDWLKMMPDGALTIYGRSDATLNRQGVRIGTAEIYNALSKIPAIEDSIILNIELEGGEHFMPLFVKLKDTALTDALQTLVRTTLKTACSPRHVPDEIIAVPDIPLTISGKKLEAPIKKLLRGVPIAKAINIDALRNPDSIAFFVQFRNTKTLLEKAL